MTDGNVRVRQGGGEDPDREGQAPAPAAAQEVKPRIPWPKKIAKYAVILRVWFPWICTLLTLLRVFLPAPYAKMMEDFVQILRHFLLII